MRLSDEQSTVKRLICMRLSNHNFVHNFVFLFKLCTYTHNLLKNINLTYQINLL